MLRRLACLIALLGAGVATLADGPSAALAEPFKLCNSFGEAAALGQFSGESPSGLGINSATGTLYAFDDGENKRIETFGAFSKCKPSSESAFTATETPLEVEGIGLAVDGTSGDVYAADTSHGLVDKFNASGEQIGALNVPLVSGVAVDTEGDVYVTSFLSHAIHVFGALGEALGEVVPHESGPVTGALLGIAANERHDLYVVNRTGNSGDVVELELSGLQVVHEVVVDSGNPTAVAVGAGTNGRLFTLDNESDPESGETEASVAARTLRGGQVESFGANGAKDIGQSDAIAAGQLGGEAGVLVADYQRNDVHFFQQGAAKVIAQKPEVQGCVAVSSTRTGATIKCFLYPEAATAKWSLGYRVAGSGEAFTTAASGEVSSPQAIEVPITGLAAGTSYTLQVTASNVNGVEAYEGEPFSAAPAVTGITSCGTASVEGTTATLAASFAPEAISTKWTFEYGPTVEYGSTTAQQVTEASGTFEASATVTALEGNSTYHCRLAASNQYGTTQGEDGSFTVPPVPPLVNEAPATASHVTRTSAVLDGTVNPENSHTTYRFQYVEGALFNPGAPDPYAAGAETEGADGGEAGHAVLVPAQGVESLKPGTLYHFRIVASNGADEPSEETLGEDVTFTTSAPVPPVATALTVGAVTQTTAVISAVIGAPEMLTSYAFEVGDGGLFQGTAAFGSVQEASEPEMVSAEFTGLVPGTSYSVRITAKNADGTTTGAESQFTTAGVTPSPIVVPVSLPLLPVPGIVLSSAVIKPKQPTNAERLAKVLSACRKKHNKKRRATCERSSRRRYMPKKGRARASSSITLG